MVIKKRYCTQRDGKKIIKVFLKPTEKFPEGHNYFYCSLEDESIIDSYVWRLDDRGVGYVRASDGKRSVFFHSLVCKQNKDSCLKFVGFANYVSFDCTRNNIMMGMTGTPKTCQGAPVRGYYRDGNAFRLMVCRGAEGIKPLRASTEDLVASRAFLEEQRYYGGYAYNFLEDMRDCLDLLDIERTGFMTHDTAILNHVKRTAYNNAWYYCRYFLYSYFRKNKLRVPKFTFDEEGYMVDLKTGERLCSL